MKRDFSSELKALKDNGVPVYSFSRLNTMKQCEYQYFLTYLEKVKGTDNIYGLLGGKIHDVIEMIYNGQATQEDLRKGLSDMLTDCELMGVTFPNEDIATNWKKNMNHFVENFKKLDYNFITEEHVLFEIIKDVWFQGYIDAYTEPTELNEIDIIDWKTSSSFNKDKKLEAGRQLIYYKKAKEEQGFKVNRVGWFMMKYIYVCHGKKRKMCERRKWVQEMNTTSKAKSTMNMKFWEIELTRLGIDEFDIEFMIEDAVRNNNIENFPKEIKEKFWLEDCILWYDVTEELEEEALSYAKEMSSNVESKLDDEFDWKAVEITNKNEFFCKNLCNHRKNCKYLKTYLTNKDINDKIEASDEDNLF